ncbi:hypothetical protein PSN45_005015 [Yamadazyma tenuis]|uniref:Uncharacterized protein n=1 Tax=Candida tenuis (strain ATCC 10573 / BCRC 21748 / CBS 615 / JCM 9827 / NBRC 10315 / NRRL Y-1498 / VKM Y-70) TaxID=590646 RepID=G3B2H2_CANTC|nr:uncharacterized protein CANTEDRAFT_104143 [Yamadazyma tenuis ATCC 10573]EGV64674.1 hypothetical protein CANTEDRAFT_104143 [Yamadazyma tenuis ATCC 10573]WEJ97464.1 hypothetical protein PSN45_005015 [Yamadazyma tenuis]
MFGAVCSGRPIQLASQVAENKYVISVPNASNVSHIAIFLLPQTEFNDPNYTALVFFQLPNSTDFKLLGGLNPNKPSGIFKLNNMRPAATTGDNDMMDDEVIDTNDGFTINIGLSIEPTAEAEVQLSQEKMKQSGASSALVPQQPKPYLSNNPSALASMANKIVSHAYNYLSSFVDGQGRVPIKAFDNWWDKFKSKLANNPNFLNELET